MKIINGNLLDTNADIIAHQVNCQGKMGSGVAKAIREKYPEVYEEYLKFETKKLGKVQVVFCNDGMLVANLYGQDKYGYDGKQYTDTQALFKCFVKLREFAKSIGKHSIAMPYGIGCGLGGADWQEVCGILEVAFKEEYGIELELWKL